MLLRNVHRRSDLGNYSRYSRIWRGTGRKLSDWLGLLRLGRRRLSLWLGLYLLSLRRRLLSLSLHLRLCLWCSGQVLTDLEMIHEALT